jgi:hypothetical protein
MGDERTFASMARSGTDKVTGRERVLTEIDAVISWLRLAGLIRAAPEAGRRRQALGLGKMLQTYFLQQ